MSFRSKHGDLSVLDTRTFVTGMKTGQEVAVELEHGKVIPTLLLMETQAFTFGGGGRCALGVLIQCWGSCFVAAQERMGNSVGLVSARHMCPSGHSYARGWCVCCWGHGMGSAIVLSRFLEAFPIACGPTGSWPLGSGVVLGCLARRPFSGTWFTESVAVGYDGDRFCS